MFYTPFSSYAKNLHKQRVIPTSCRIPTGSQKTEEDAQRKYWHPRRFKGF